MRKGFQAKSNSRSTHANSSRRSAVLLPNAELSAAVCHRTGGEEAHRQPHEPARNKGASGRHIEDAPPAAASRRRGQTRAVLPAVLRATVPAIPDERRVQAGGGRRVSAGAVTGGRPALAHGAA